jgi:dTMP kinase
MRGKFITFEGGEGTGKSTQAQALAARLKKLGIAVTLTILSGAAKPLGPDAEAMLFAAAREDHIAHTIRPALDLGRWVVCDRFADSTRVYQGVLGHVDQRLIKRLEKITVGDNRPDLTLILDAPAEVGLARAQARRGNGVVDRFESEDIAFHERLREAYHQLAIEEPERCVLIDATQSPDEVSEAIWAVVSRKLDPATAPLAIEEAH